MAALSWKRWLDLPALLCTPVGRVQIRGGALHRGWPITSLFLELYRRTLLRKTRVVAVTGSYGKSTTMRAVRAALGERVRRQLPGNHKDGLTRAVCLLRPWDVNAVMEIGIDGPGQMRSMARVARPEIAVVTCIGSEHNRSLKTLETTRNEKAELVRALPASGRAVLNGDDEHVRWMAGQTKAGTVFFGFGPENEIRASQVELEWPNRMRLRIETPRGNRTVQVRLTGRYMVYPVLAAVAVALEEGCDLDECLERLAELKPTLGRMETRPLDNGALLLCDYYKSSYETVTAALEVFGQLPAKRRIVVMGEISEPPGSQGPIYREIGKRIAQASSRAVFVGHNFQRYKAGATRAGMPASALVDAGGSWSLAVDAIRDDLGPGDVVLIKGRDVQRLDRIALALQGRPVGCGIAFCQVKEFRCHACPMLERGWSRHTERT